MVLVLAMLLPMLPGDLSLSFAGNDDHVVTYGSNQTKGFVKFSEAWDFANSVNGTIDMHADAFLGRQLKLSENHTVTLNMNGYMINRGKTDPNDIKKVHDSGGDGTIFYLNSKSHLIINGGTDAESMARTHKGRLISDVWYYDNNGSTVFKGALITGSGSDSYECAAINVADHAELTIKDVNIAGNVSDTYGWITDITGGRGAVVKVVPNSAYHDVASNAKIHMENCTIYNNYARKNGAVINVTGHENAEIELIGCKIASNVTDGEGGAIYVSKGSNGASITLTNTWLHDNTAEDGAAIYIEAEKCTVEGGKFEFNHARENGAAIYLKGIENTVRDATIHKNDAKEKGGGIFIYQEDCTLSGCTITENKAGTNGGGVYLNSNNWVYVPKTHLSGKLIIKDNTVGGKKNNLYLEPTSYEVYRAAKIMGVPAKDSEIWVTSGDTTGVITYIPDSYNDAVFHSDNSDYNVYWGYNKNNSKEYRHLVIGKGTSQRIALPSLTLKPGTIYRDGSYTADFTLTGVRRLKSTQYTYNNWPVYKGYGREDGTTDIGAYYYSDGYFQDDATKYNEHLATLSLRMAAAGYNSGVWSDTKGNKWEYKLQPAHVKQMLSDIGILDEDIYLSDSYFVKPGMDSIACAIGSKTLLDVNGNDKGLVLVPIVVRGAGYENEWASNVTLGYSGLHQGFNEAATQVVDIHLANYLKQHPDIREKLNEGKVRFWVTGFSRAGATANLVSKKLIDEYQGKHNVIYGYPLEAPQGGIDSEKVKGSDYTTIHNVILPGDLVPNVAMIAMGFQRFGVDHYLPGTEASSPVSFRRKYYNLLTAGKDDAVFKRDNVAYDVGSAAYEDQKKIMLRQLAASNPNRMFDDYFHLATVGVSSTYEKQIWHEIGDGKVPLEQWLSDLTYYLNEWLVNGKRDDARKFYVDKEQDALRRVMERMQGGEGMNIDKALDRMKSFMFITGVIAIATHPVSLNMMEQQLLNLCMREKIFADDAIPLNRSQAEAVVDIFCRLLWGDLTLYSHYSEGTTVPYRDVGLAENLIMIPTLIYNADRILQNHMTDVVYAWLRSYDSYYTDNTDGVSDFYYVGLQADTSKVGQPYLTYELNGEEHTLKAGETLTVLDTDELKKLALHNAERNQGGLIFYDIALGGGKPEKADKYYSGTEVFSDAFEEKDGKNTIKGNSAVIAAKTLWHDAPGEIAQFNIIVKKATYRNVYILKRGEDPINTDSGYEFYSTVKEWDSFTVKWPLEDGWNIASWEYYVYTKGADHFGNILNIAESVSEDNTTLQLKMPGSETLQSQYHLYLVPKWEQMKVSEPVFSVEPGVWDHDLSVELSTPAGTEEEGYTIRYTMESKGPDYDGEYGGGDYFAPLRLYGSEYGPVTYKIKAQAFHEGWLPSSEVAAEYTIDYRKKVFTVNVIDGTLADTGKSSGTFHTGDLVFIQASVPEKSIFKEWIMDPDTIRLDNKTAISAAFTMPYHDVTATASFTRTDVPAPIYVDGGTAYNEAGEKITEAHAGQRVYLMARDPQTDSNGHATERFASWTGPDSVSFAHEENERTHFVMPLLGDPKTGVHLKANFTKMYKVNVTNGYASNADGNHVTYAVPGEKITLSHDAMGNPERVFTKWDFVTVPADDLDLTQDRISFVMPGWDVTATAIFRSMYKITVYNGTAKNAAGTAVTYAAEGEMITITADDMGNPEHVFSKWEFSTLPTQGLDLTKPVLSFKMPARDITATANFRGMYNITVVNGTARNAAGSAVTHAARGERITITPNDTVAPNHAFSRWIFVKVPEGVLDLTKRSISFTMPEYDVTATADFEGMYQVNVFNGYAVNKDGKPVTYAAEGDRITIIPDTDHPEHVFSKWTFDREPAGVTDLTRHRISFRMPGRDVTATAIFRETQKHKITVTNGYAVNAKGSVVSYAAPGDKVTILPHDADNREHTFRKWEFATMPAEGLDLTRRNLSFEMPERDVVATARIQYTIRVIHGHAEDAKGQTITAAFPGEKVKLVPDEPAKGMVFDHWQISNGLKNAVSNNKGKLLELLLPAAVANTSTDLVGHELIMPESAVTAEAIYSRAVPETGDSSAPVLWTLLGIGSVWFLLCLRSKGRKRAVR